MDFEKGNLTLVFDGLPQKFCSSLLVKKLPLKRCGCNTYVSFHMNKLGMGAKPSLAKVAGKGGKVKNQGEKGAPPSQF